MIFIIDFDGTLATEDTVDKLLEHHACSAWRALETDWLAGRLSALECMQGQVRLVQAERPVLDKFFQSIELDPGFAAFHRHVRDYAAVAIVSDGLDHTIHATLQRDQLPQLPVYANQLHFVPPDRLDLSFPHLDPDCRAGNGVCKCAIAKRLADQHGGPVILVGDGKSDACLAAEADAVFAKGSLIRHCQAAGIPYIPFENFADVLKIVQTWDTTKLFASVA